MDFLTHPSQGVGAAGGGGKNDDEEDEKRGGRGRSAREAIFQSSRKGSTTMTTAARAAVALPTVISCEVTERLRDTAPELTQPRIHLAADDCALPLIPLAV